MSSDFGVMTYETVDLYAGISPDLSPNGEMEVYAPEDAYMYDDVYYPNYGTSIDKTAVILFSLVFLVGLALVLVLSRIEFGMPTEETVAETAVSSQNKPADTSTKNLPADTLKFVAPYTDYAITQGLHGQSYGHMAIDIAAGRGEPILSPINGVVTQLFVDEYGNTTIVIENDVYQVMFLHGDYSVAKGDTLKAGQQFGTEGNNGYTMDMAGNLCYNREWCGNHSHINVFDKRLGTNINPLDLIIK